MIANNSSGAHVPYYGLTSDHVIELELVLAWSERVNWAVEQIAGAQERIGAELSKVIIGQHDVIEHLLIAVLCGGDASGKFEVTDVPAAEEAPTKAWREKLVEAAAGRAKVLVSNRNLLVVADLLVVNEGFAEKHAARPMLSTPCPVKYQWWPVPMTPAPR